MPDNSPLTIVTKTKPTRPSTPTLDTYYATYHGAQNPRYTEDANGVVDNALNTFHGDAKQGLFDQSAVNADDVTAAETYLDDVEAFKLNNGGFWIPDASGETTGTMINTSSTSGSTGSTGSTDSGTETTTEQSSATPELRTVPSTGTDVAIPDHVAGSFPDGSTVVEKSAGYLVASVPSPKPEHEGKFWHIVGEVGESIEHLAERVETFLARVL